MSHAPARPLAVWLAGRWEVRRVINDGAGTFRGRADFRDDGAGGLEWSERGRLALGGLDAPASRTLRLVPDAAGAWEVRFDDGRPFHALDLRGGAWRAEHRCGEDVYRGRFEVHDDRRMTIRWEVAGPRKADVIDSEYRRAGAVP